MKLSDLNNGYCPFEFEPAWPLENDDGSQALPFCEIRIVDGLFGFSVAIVTSAHNHEGESLNHNLSITNGIEKIATRLFKLGVRWHQFIEHYPKRGEHFEIAETLDKVTFSFNTVGQFVKPTWKHLSHTDVQNIIGKPFPDYYDKDAWNDL